jgi:hypothetical protein
LGIRRASGEYSWLPAAIYKGGATEIVERTFRVIRGEAGRMELHLEFFPLAPLIADTVKTIEPLAANKANQVAVHCGAEVGIMQADQMRLRHAIYRNLPQLNQRFLLSHSVRADIWSWL